MRLKRQKPSSASHGPEVELTISMRNQGYVRQVLALLLACAGRFHQEHPFSARANIALKWAVKNVPLGFDVSLIAAPEVGRGRNYGGGASQAPGLQPEMLWALDGLFCEMVNEPCWTALACACFMAFGGIRFAHLQRSALLKADTIAMYFWCARGRQSFYWSSPRRTRSGFDLLPALRSHFSRFNPEDLSSRRMALAFDVELKLILDTARFNGTMRANLAILLANPEDFSSYSLRRVAPTVATPVGTTEEQRLAFGNWVGR